MININIDQTIFKAYDIRGIYPQQIDEDIAYALGRGYATFIKKNNQEANFKIAVGSDMRLSSPAIKEKVIAALLDSGLDVDDIGLVSTPTFYFAVAYHGYGGGLQISASHNPKEWNGLKIVRRNAVPISGDSGIYEIRDIVLSEQFCPLAEKRGILNRKADMVSDEAENQYDFVGGTEFAKGIKKFKIAADASSGMGAMDMQVIFGKLACDLIKINFELDGNFPAHGADPMKGANTVQLQKAVLENKCDFGIIADGDADRYFFCDEKGEMLPQAILRGIMAEIELQNDPKAVVAYDIRPGKITKDIIDSCGGKAIITPVGHSLIKEEMIKNNAVFGGESSGHYFYKLPYGTFEAPMVLILKFLKFLSQQNKPFSEIVAPYKKYASSGEINIKVSNRDIITTKIQELKAEYSGGKQSFVDGLSVEYPDFWFNLRASNTEPLLRFTLEAKDKNIMEEKRDEILKTLQI